MRIVRFGLVVLLAAGCAPAQLGRFTRGAKSPAGADPAAALAQGQAMVTYVTIASDLGVQAVEKVASVFPPEKTANLLLLAAKYNELKSKRSDNNIDAESIKVGSDIAREVEKLEADWQCHLKEKSGAVRSADARLALALLADGQAAAQAPLAARALQTAVQDIKGNPAQAAKATRLISMANVLMVVASELPGQINSFRRVRAINRRIAEAEKFQLPPDPPADKVRDSAALTSSEKELDS